VQGGGGRARQVTGAPGVGKFSDGVTVSTVPAARVIRSAHGVGNTGVGSSAWAAHDMPATGARAAVVTVPGASASTVPAVVE